MILLLVLGVIVELLVLFAVPFPVFEKFAGNTPGVFVARNACDHQRGGGGQGEEAAGHEVQKEVLG